MYVPRPFQQGDLSRVHQLVVEVGAGDLVSVARDGRPMATRVPLVWELPDDGGAGVVHLHLARANPHWQELADGGRALLIVSGPQAYVSPTYYPSKSEHGRVVPTWNYAIAHLHGTVRVTHSADELLGIVSGLTRENEQRRTHPWQVSDAPEDYLAQQLAAIVGVELTLDEVTTSFKLSQNKSVADHEGVRQALEASCRPRDRRVAELMAEWDGSGKR